MKKQAFKHISIASDNEDVCGCRVENRPKKTLVKRPKKYENNWLHNLRGECQCGGEMWRIFRRVVKALQKGSENSLIHISDLAAFLKGEARNFI